MTGALLAGGPHDVTTLTSTARLAAHKTITARGGGYDTVGYGKAAKFSASVANVADANMLYELALKLQTCPHSFIVRGAVRANANPYSMRRLAHDKHDERTGEVVERTLEEVPRSWAMFDLDDVETRRSDWFHPSHLIDEVRWTIDRHFPPEFRGCAFVATATSQAGLTAGMRARVSVLFGRPWLGHEVERAMKHVPLDFTTLRVAQAIYTCAPVFIGMADPVQRRVAYFWGDRDTVPLVVPPAPPKPKIDLSSFRSTPWGGAGLTLDHLHDAVLRATKGGRRMTLFGCAARSMDLIREGKATHDEVFAALGSAALLAGIPGSRQDIAKHISNGLARGATGGLP
ncbi:MAG TPA: hypothetical protein VHL31_11335 [Geminicoccus sp.]|jgi:hypothetical protein|uniref:hypothetical protein n=1 Tax=Geminicoccus sp. TaxID=2024832 RepID=UPI002E361ADF|nr:hypothetical protein [Geminicoccus sp.]HEX2526873.1 hypothetical protein [Geminicoccus sp.]